MRTPEMKKKHFCDVTVNKRLQRAKKWIEQRLTFTGIEMTQAGISASPRDTIRELNGNGMNILRETERSPTGARISRWSLM